MHEGGKTRCRAAPVSRAKKILRNLSRRREIFPALGAGASDKSFADGTVR